MRHDGRTPDQIRPVTIEPGFTTNPAGSALIRCGNTMVLCTASAVFGVPRFREGKGGWMTAEYAMAPGSTHSRTRRESQNRVKGRTHEIQRLIGRSLRAGVDLVKLGDNTVHLDCEVLQADGGTRTASVTGAFVALALACGKLMNDGAITESPLTSIVTAVSCGIVKGEAVADLDYPEDSTAEVDMNLVMLADGTMVEVQATGEDGTMSRSQLNALLDIGERGISTLRAHQLDAIGPFATDLGLV